MRPRRWLEIRYLDSVPDSLWPALVFTLVTLLDDPGAAAVAVEATEPVADAWDRAARIGLADRRLHEAAFADVCRRRAGPGALQDSMRELVRIVEEGSCPGEAFSERVIRYGVPSAVTQLARGEV